MRALASRATEASSGAAAPSTISAPLSTSTRRRSSRERLRAWLIASFVAIRRSQCRIGRAWS